MRYWFLCTNPHSSRIQHTIILLKLADKIPQRTIVYTNVLVSRTSYFCCIYKNIAVKIQLSLNFITCISSRSFSTIPGLLHYEHIPTNVWSALMHRLLHAVLSPRLKVYHVILITNSEISTCFHFSLQVIILNTHL
jgi:hypothetical protein